MKNPKTSPKSKALIERILRAIPGLSKPRKNFFVSLMILYLSMRGRYTFKGMERYGSYCEKTYRLHFERSFDFIRFNAELIRQNLSKELVLVFDPSYLPKSGKHTPHIDRFWSGCLGKAVRGIEIGVLGVVDIQNNTAFNLEAVQTPSQENLHRQGLSLMEHYAKIIIDRQEKLAEMSKYLVADGYFSKKGFVDAIMTKTPFHLISKLRKDANLKYLYTGPQKTGRGRPKKYDGKINLDNIDHEKFQKVYQDDQIAIYQVICHAVSLKRDINLLYVQSSETGSYKLLYSTDLELSWGKIFSFYRARFQIEFLFRDAKQHTGLTHCQSRSENKLHFHFNAALTAVGIAKVTHYLGLEEEQRNTFSMADVKTRYFNELMLNLFLSNFQIRPDLKKNKSIINKLLEFGTIAA